MVIYAEETTKVAKAVRAEVTEMKESIRPLLEQRIDDNQLVGVTDTSRPLDQPGDDKCATVNIDPATTIHIPPVDRYLSEVHSDIADLSQSILKLSSQVHDFTQSHEVAHTESDSPRQIPVISGRKDTKHFDNVRRQPAPIFRRHYIGGITDNDGVDDIVGWLNFKNIQFYGVKLMYGKVSNAVSASVHIHVKDLSNLSWPDGVYSRAWRYYHN